MTLVPLDLPTPDEMRGRWAAFAAICAARGFDDICHANRSRWHFEDGGGNWADLVHRGEGRAVLFGHDREGQTYFRTAADYFDRPETDLLAGAPQWWASPVEAMLERPYGWVGFVYGFEAGGWSRAPYDVADGFARVGLPAVADDACRVLVAEFCEELGDPDTAAVDALIAADGQVTEEMVRAVLDGPDRDGSDWDAAAGAAAARAFRAG